jgi:hypothetical protein
MAKPKAATRTEPERQRATTSCARGVRDALEARLLESIRSALPVRRRAVSYPAGRREPLQSYRIGASGGVENVVWPLAPYIVPSNEKSA